MDETISDVAVLDRPPVEPVKVETPVTETVKPESPFTPELSNQFLEKKLGIETNTARLMEAALFIDKKFLNTAVITGNPPHPELMFGEKEWNSYLATRVLAKSYGDRPLTPTFLKVLHRTLTQATDPKNAGNIRSDDLAGANYSNPDQPLTLTPDQIRAIKENPYLSFEKSGDSNTSGFINYLHSKINKDINAITIEKALIKVCADYNKYRASDSYDPFIAAATLQHQLASIHPFKDSNGTLSRILMNWSLEKDGQPPSVLEDPDDDVLTDEHSWVAKVRDGSYRREFAMGDEKAYREAGLDVGAATMVGVEQEKAFYDHIYKYLELPPSPSPNGILNHQEYADFLSKLTTEYGLFMEKMSADSRVERRGLEPVLLYQGGLVTDSYIKLYEKNPLALPESLKSIFFDNVELYRGNMSNKMMTDQVLCEMFVKPTPLNSSYLVNEQAGQSDMSPYPVDPKHGVVALQRYNELVASYYLDLYHKGYIDVRKKNLSNFVFNHTKGGEENVTGSPFVSTSVDETQARLYAFHFSTPSAVEGVLIKSSSPRQGVILTFGKNGSIDGKLDIQALKDGHNKYATEKEALIGGAVLPASISEIKAYKKAGEGPLAYGEVAAIARKVVDENGNIVIEIEDRRGEFVVNKKYAYIPKLKIFRLASEETTDTKAEAPKSRLRVLLDSLDEKTPKPDSTYSSNKYEKYLSLPQMDHTEDKWEYENKSNIKEYDIPMKNYIMPEQYINDTSYFDKPLEYSEFTTSKPIYNSMEKLKFNPEYKKELMEIITSILAKNKEKEVPMPALPENTPDNLPDDIPKSPVAVLEALATK